ALHAEDFGGSFSLQPPAEHQFEKVTASLAEDEALAMHDYGSLRRFLARKESVEAAQRPWHLDSMELQSGIRRQREGEDRGWRLDPKKPPVMADLTNVALAFDVVDAANLEIRLTVTVHVQDELEDVLRQSPDDGSPFAAHHEGFRHGLRLRRPRPDPFREQAKIIEPEARALGQTG